MTGTELITLTALMEALSINNPCHHTGLESFVCEDCGYPDPRKIIAALKAERGRLKTALGEIEYIVNCKAYSTAHGSVISGICEKAFRGGKD